MDSTSFPVESQNQIVHSHLGVHTNLNIEKGIEQMATYMDEKAIMSQNTSFQNLDQMNLSSRSPKRQYIVLQSQAIADQNYDANKKFKLCRKGSSTWYCWCLNQLYPIMKQYGKCLHFPATNAFVM